jgi:aspartate kinase
MMPVVHKFGGSSLATIVLLEAAAQRIANIRRAGPVVVVVSAQGDTTDALLAQAGEVAAQPPPRELDQLLATGEYASAALLAMALQQLGVPAVSLTGPQAGVRAAGGHGAGTVAEVRPARIRRVLADGVVPVVAGFQGVNRDGDIVTLGRGGSDTTAVALAAALDTRVCVIWTDVDGVCTADPRLVPAARVLSTVEVRVMAEMAFAGAQVLHPRAVGLAGRSGVDIHVGSALSGRLGTTVSNRRAGLEWCGVTAVAHDQELALVTVTGPARSAGRVADVFAVLATRSVPIDMLAQSRLHDGAWRLSFAAHGAELDPVRGPLCRVVSGQSGRIDIDDDAGKVSVVGDGLVNRPDYLIRFQAALATVRADPSHLVAAAQHRISAAVPRRQTARAVAALHREFGLAGRIDRAGDDLVGDRAGDDGDRNGSRDALTPADGSPRHE